MGWEVAAERIRARLFRRRDAFRAVFAPHGKAGPDAEIVMRDLARYCHVHKSSLKVSPITKQSDAIAMGFAEGQRDVFNYIMSQLGLTEAQIERIAYSKENGNE